MARGEDVQDASRGGYVNADDCIPQDHPLREIRKMANRALAEMSSFFDTLYLPFGRASIPPEHLLRALLLQILFTIRSERQLMEQMRYNLLFRWFVGLGMNDPVWDTSVFTKNRDRLLRGEVAEAFFQRILAQAREADLLSDEHFTVDGTLIEAWASHKSFQRKEDDDGSGSAGTPPRVSDLGEGGKNPSVDFHGEKRSNQTHASLTDPDARLARKNAGSAAVLAHSGHALMENRNGLVVDTLVIPPSGIAERAAATHMAINLVERLRAEGVLPAAPPTPRPETLELFRKYFLVAPVSNEENAPEAGVEIANAGTERPKKVTLGADKGYDCPFFVAICKHLGIDPHIARNTKRRGGSALDEKLEQEAGYAISQRRRKLVEEIFGWLKMIGTIRKVKIRGTELVGWMFTLNAAAYNLRRMVSLLTKKHLPVAA